MLLNVLLSLWALSSCSQAAVQAYSPSTPLGPWLAPASGNSKPAIENPYVAAGPTYNVSANQAIRIQSPTGLNSHWVGHFVTTTENLHFVLITFTNAVPGGSGNSTYGGSANGCLVFSLETGGFSSSFAQATPTLVGQDRLRIKFGEQYELHSLTDDNISSIGVIANFSNSNFSLDTTFQPQGSLLFNGGSGSFFWGSVFNQGWASPSSYTTGTFTLNGTKHIIDSNRSTTWYDRQWGEETPSKGWYWVPIQLENGIRISTWIVPTEQGALKAFATALYPDGRQEIVGVNPDIKPRDPWVSPSTKRTWYGSFEVSFLDEQDSVITAVAPNVTSWKYGEASYGASFAFCDSFVRYSGTWKGEEVRGWGIVEQWPAS
ncbi:hypothetical protein BBK36DRAFT_1110246 [Trichoderma citrinoviride]|uniref:AttH domain-containing protein n=1 Tax=Trichoderma citrinoviride TaxID=58853 RepID=A0A2T4BKX3_9HYPO|nr:hypothetical protein BBK36DRAFT_1110246 [Trichoderma citrinoviride]PTB69931.1 hypothetical protein BBK36DRAFT_1110246 [Trichoderma citrinoviride]